MSALKWRLYAAYPRIRDIGGPIFATAVVLYAAHSNYATGPKRLDLLGAGLIMVSNLPVVLRNRAPILVLLVCCAGMSAFAAAGYWEALNGVGALAALYTVAGRYPPRRSIPAAFVEMAAAVYCGLVTGAVAFWLLMVLTPQFSFTAWMLGNFGRVLDARNRQLTTLTEQLALDRTARARRAVIEERVRLARELHDVVAHHMSAISVQAGLARYVFRTDPDTAYTAVQAIGAASGKALEDMRRLLTLLRFDPEQPLDAELAEVGLGVDRLDELAATMSAAGVPVTVTVTGTVRALAPGVELCIYRVVQESLTNVLKHAGPARARVSVDYREHEIVVHVVDDGRGSAPPRQDSGHGQGLIGMRERAKLYGGTLTTGARAQGGFGVVLTLPLSSETVADTGNRQPDDHRTGR